MTQRKPKTYEAKIDGRKTRVTVPSDPDPEEILVDAIRDTLSPQAVAVIAAFLQPARTANNDVDKQIRWFADTLVKAVGGQDTMNGLYDEVGL